MSDDSTSDLKTEISKLQEELHFTRALLESANSIVVRWHANGIIHELNDFGLRFFGYSSEELIGQHITKIVPNIEKSSGRDVSGLAKDIAKHPDQYKSVQSENITKGGRTVWVTWANKGILDEQGNVQEILSIGNDITALKEAEQKRFEYQEKLNAALESMDDAIFISDSLGNFVQFNKAFATFHRFKDKSECLDQLADYPKILEVFLPDGERLPLDQWVVARALRGETGANAEYTLLRKDTEETWIGSYNFAPFFDQHGNIVGSVVSARDITDQKKVKDDLKKSEERHRLFNNPSFGGSIVHDKGLILDCSSGITNITGYSYDELIGMDGLLLIAPDWRDFVMDKIKSGCDQPYEAESIRKDGTIFPARLHATTIEYNGKPTRLVEFRDISEIKKTEQALKESEDLLRNIIDSSTDCIFVKDKNLKTILCNKPFAQAVNKKPSDLIGNTDIENGWDEELVKGNPEKGIKGYEKDDLEALSGKIIQNTDTATISGKTLYFDSVKIPLRDENNKIFGVLGISRDITEKTKAEQALKASEEQFRTLVNTSPFPIAVLDLTGEKILHWSKSTQDMFGHRPTTAAEWFSLAYPDPQYRQEVIARSKPYLERAQHSKTAVNTGEYQIVCRDGSVKICEIYAQVISGHLILTNNDITELKKVESEKDHLIDELKLALAKVKKLEGILPVCMYCKKIRDDEGSWEQLEEYLAKHSDAQLSHGICQECADRVYGQESWYKKKKTDS